MKNLLKKLASVFVATYLLGMFLVPITQAAVNCDLDNDGYITISSATMALIDENLPYDANGNYDPIQWNSFYGIYTSAVEGGVLTPEEQCQNINFKKGAEPSRCDSVIIASDSGVYDTDKVSSLAGNRVNPGAFDTAANGIDEDCDGGDGKFIAAATNNQNLGGLVGKTLNLLASAVVVISVIILIYGGILYSTAAGDEQKTSKARKAIIGAIIGLIVGLLAPAIVDFILSQLV